MPRITFVPDQRVGSAILNNLSQQTVSIFDNLAAIEAAFPVHDRAIEGQLALAKDTGIVYRWSGSTWTQLTGSGGNVPLTDDAVLDLAQTTRATTDRGKALGTSTTNQDELALLTIPEVTTATVLDAVDATRTSSDRGKLVAIDDANENQFELIDAPSGTGGLDEVTSDTTLTGEGTSSSPLSVANPFTAADETKLDGIAAGAEVNVQSDWAANSGDAEILNKPTLPTVDDASILAAAKATRTSSDRDKLLATSATDENDLVLRDVPTGGGTLTDDAVLDLAKETRNASDRDKLLATSSTDENALVLRSVPSGGGGLTSVTSDSTLTGDGTSGSPLGVANEFTHDDEVKLDGIAAGAEVNVQSDWDATSGDAQILNKPTIPTPRGAGTGLELDGNNIAIEDGGVGTAQLADDAVTTAKLNDMAVGSAQLKPNAVTAGAIAAGAVNTSELADGAVTAAKIGAPVEYKLDGEVSVNYNSNTLINIPVAWDKKYVFVSKTQAVDVTLRAFHNGSVVLPDGFRCVIVKSQPEFNGPIQVQGTTLYASDAAVLVWREGSNWEVTRLYDQQQADWNASGNSPEVILNKPTIPTVDDDSILDLAQATRTSADRGKVLSVSATNENELALTTPASGGGNPRGAGTALELDGNNIGLDMVETLPATPTVGRVVFLEGTVANRQRGFYKAADTNEVSIVAATASGLTGYDSILGVGSIDPSHSRILRAERTSGSKLKVTFGGAAAVPSTLRVRINGTGTYLAGTVSDKEFTSTANIAAWTAGTTYRLEFFTDAGTTPFTVADAWEYLGFVSDASSGGGGLTLNTLYDATFDVTQTTSYAQVGSAVWPAINDSDIIICSINQPGASSGAHTATVTGANFLALGTLDNISFDTTNTAKSILIPGVSFQQFYVARAATTNNVVLASNTATADPMPLRIDILSGGGGGGGGTPLTDDSVLDLAKATRTTADRGKVLGVSDTNENELALLDSSAASVTTVINQNVDITSNTNFADTGVAWPTTVGDTDIMLITGNFAGVVAAAISGKHFKSLPTIASPYALDPGAAGRCVALHDTNSLRAAYVGRTTDGGGYGRIIVGSQSTTDDPMPLRIELLTLGSGGGGGGADLTDDSVLDLAQETRATTDRGKALGTSATNQDELALLDIPAAQVPADWDASTGVSRILNKPTIPTVTDDSILDLAQATRTSADRGKVLGISSTNENELDLLSLEDGEIEGATTTIFNTSTAYSSSQENVSAAINLNIKSGSTRYTWDEFDAIVLYIVEANNAGDFDTNSATFPATVYAPISLFAANGDNIGTFMRGRKGIRRAGASSFNMTTSDADAWSYTELVQIVGIKFTVTPASGMGSDVVFGGYGTGSNAQLLLWGYFANLTAAETAADGITATFDGTSFNTAGNLTLNGWVHSRDDLGTRPNNTQLFSALANAFSSGATWDIDPWEVRLSDSSYDLFWTSAVSPDNNSLTTGSQVADSKWFRRREPSGLLSPWIRAASFPSTQWVNIAEHSSNFTDSDIEFNLASVLDLTKYRELLFSWEFRSADGAAREGYCEARITTDQLSAVTHASRATFDAGVSIGARFDSRINGGSMWVAKAIHSEPAGSETEVQTWNYLNLVQQTTGGVPTKVGTIRIVSLYSRNRAAVLRIAAR